MSGLHIAIRNVLHIVFRLFFGSRVVGGDRVPTTGGVIIASNHVSYADPLVIGTWSPRMVHFLAKRELFSNPLIGALLRRIGAVPVRRGMVERNTLRLVEEILREGDTIVIFPEGTRSRDCVVRDARPGIGLIAASADVPVLPLYLRGSRHMGRSLFRRGELSLFFGEPIHPASVMGETQKEKYRRIGESVMEEIRRLQSKNM